MVPAREIQDAIAIEISEQHFSTNAAHGCRRDRRRSEAPLAIAEHHCEVVVFGNNQIDMPILVHIAADERVPATGNSERRRRRGLVIYRLSEKWQRTAQKNNARVF